MDLSIIIVNWNSREYLKKCIESIFQQTRGIRFEIIVIDSASFDGCGEMLQTLWPQEVRFIQSRENIGFARANNEAFKCATGEAVLFLNPDTEILEGAINVTLQTLQSRLDSGAVGCKLLNSDGSIQITSTRAFPTLMNQLFESDFLRRCFPRSSLWGMAPLFSEGRHAVSVDALSGAFLMFRRGVFERVGMFTTEYFMYSEDIDICLKARRAGCLNLYEPKARVVHHGGGSSAQTKVNTFSSIMMTESRWRFFRTHRSSSYALLYRVSVCGGSILRTAFAVILWLANVAGQPRRWKAAARKWAALFRWSIGLEGWVKNYRPSDAR